ncbi:peptidase family M48-domain-containing protein [Gorgonomyces haynaldii]|nr:peptidase family M48-domain-containing protein [Gorgonomyces haynaldii]
MFLRLWKRFTSRQPKYQYFETKQDSRVYWIAGGLGVCGGAYYISHLEKVPISNRTRFMNTSVAQEERLGEIQYQQLLAEYRNHILPLSHPYTQFVHQVAKRLIRAARLEHVHWDIHVIQDRQMNAFVLPGGKIFVFTGLLPVAQNQDGLAAVLGHEMAHQMARHAGEKMSFVNLIMSLQFALKVMFDLDPGPFLRNFVVNFGLMLPFSRECEKEADHIGLLLMAQACYDPNAAVDMWKRMAQMEKNAGPEFMSTHPSHETRVEMIKQWLPEAYQKRQDAGCISLPWS